MLNFLDNFLDNITMYYLTWNILRVLIGISVVFAFFGIIHYSPWAILITCFLLVYEMLIVNKIFSYLFSAPVNKESVYISALILTLIIPPIKTIHDIVPLFATGAIVIASKFILAIQKRHVFNPVAIGVVVSSFAYSYYASWWIGTSILLPFVAVCGFLLIKKLQRWDLVGSFLIATTGVTLVFAYLDKISLFASMQALFLESAVVFFATVMLTEPLTTPPNRLTRIIYGVIAGIIFVPQIHIGFLYATPEIALVVANIFSYLVGSKQKLLLTLVEKKDTVDGIAEFIFSTPKPIKFLPGQYMEWTLPHTHIDSRGNRRYFTLASSPTENNPQLGVKFYENPSSYKKALKDMAIGQTIAAGALSGEFTLPKDTQQKLVFLAGGIGITPFRSMIKYLVDTKKHWDIILFYINKNESDVRYQDIFSKAKELGVRTIYINSSKKRLTIEDIEQEIPDFKTRLFYLSGSHVFVKSFEDMLTLFFVSKNHIKKDFFPGLV